MRDCLVWLTSACIFVIGAPIAYADMFKRCKDGPAKRETKLWLGAGVSVRDTADTVREAMGDFALDAATTFHVTGKLRVGPWLRARWQTVGATATLGGARVDLNVGEAIYGGDHITHQTWIVDVGGGWDWRGDAEGAPVLAARLGWGVSRRPTWHTVLYNPDVTCPEPSGMGDWIGRPPGGMVSGLRIVAGVERELSAQRAWTVTVGLEFEPLDAIASLFR